ncbi:MAG: WD40 repeat domain-containing protein [Cyanobacteria bacterium J06634_5]
MYRNNQNLFSVIAVLIAAGLITGICSLFLLLANQIGGSSKVIAPSISTADEAAVSNQNDSVATRDSDDASNSQASPWASTVLGSHTGSVLKVNAQLLSSVNPLIASGSYDNTVKIWNPESKETLSLTQNGRVNDLTFIPATTSAEETENVQSRRIATGSGSGEIKLWDLETGDLTATVSGQAGRIISLAVDPNGTHIASGSSNGTIQVWPLTGNAASVRTSQVKALVTVGPQINALAFHPTDSNVLISGDHDGIIQVWNLDQDEPTLTLDGDIDRILGLAVSSDGQYVASGSKDNLIQIWNLTTGEQVQSIEGHDFVVASVAFSPDGQMLASGSYDESIKMWDWAQAKELCTLNGHSGFVHTVAFTDSGSVLVSGGYDGTVRTWNLTDAKNQGCLVR